MFSPLCSRAAAIVLQRRRDCYRQPPLLHSVAAAIVPRCRRKSKVPSFRPQTLDPKLRPQTSDPRPQTPDLRTQTSDPRPKAPMPEPRGRRHGRQPFQYQIRAQPSYPTTPHLRVQTPSVRCPIATAGASSVVSNRIITTRRSHHLVTSQRMINGLLCCM